MELDETSRNLLVVARSLGRMDRLHRLTPASPWEPDPLLMDERWVAADIKGLGVMVFSACSHADRRCATSPGACAAM